MVWDETQRILDGFTQDLDERADGEGCVVVADSAAVVLQMTLVSIS